MQCTDIMLDLETMGTGSNAAIIAIGAVAMGRNLQEPIIGKFYLVIDLASSVEHGGIVDKSTELWWSQQGVEARRIFDDPTIERHSIHQALFSFAAWMKEVLADRQNTCMWGNGSDFDNVILTNAYDRLGLDPPWGPFNNRCYRTLKKLRPNMQLARVGTHHNALDDAESQALHMLTLLSSVSEDSERWGRA